MTAERLPWLAALMSLPAIVYFSYDPQAPSAPCPDRDSLESCRPLAGGAATVSDRPRLRSWRTGFGLVRFFGQ